MPYGLAIGIMNFECVSKWHECDNLTDYQRFVFLAFITVSKANKIQINHTLALIQSSLVHLKLTWGHLNQAPSDTNISVQGRRRTVSLRTMDRLVLDRVRAYPWPNSYSSQRCM